MLDPRSLAERRDEIVESCRRRGVDADIDAAVHAYEAAAAARTALGEANHRRNEHQKSGKGKLAPAEREAHVAAGRELKEVVGQLEAAVAKADAALAEAMAPLPNFIHPDVPVGGEDDGRTVRVVGEPTQFDFEPLDHLELGHRLDLVDFESGSKVAGTKFYFLKNEAVLLELGLQRLALDTLRAAGFTLYTTPDLAKPDMAAGLGYNPRGPETQVYSVANENLCLIGTSEITLGGIHADSILAEADLPLRMAGVSHCFRTEAGSHGRESKGLYRIHQFTKVEMFVIARPEDSEAIHEELLAIEEGLFQALELPYRVIDIASGDLGAPAYRKYDLEAWMPGRGEGGSWGEVTSASNCTDYQARNLRIRFRRTDSKKTELVHMLNGTAFAVPRTLLALLENHQCADGSVRIPKALQPYAGCEVIGPR